METRLRSAVPFVVLWACCVAPAQGQAPPAPAADGNQPAAPPEVTCYQYRVVRTYPHDRQLFTQGLVYRDGLIYEGTGLYGRSAILRWELKTGNVLKRLRLPDRYFGEGITLFDDKLIQLTWKSNVGFVYSRDTFTLRGQFRYPMEGWGLTHNGQRLILSDGTATLHFLDPNTYAETGRLEVRDRGRPVRGLNELEFIPGRFAAGEATEARDEGNPPRPACAAPTSVSQAPPFAAGLIYANVWPTERVVVICPQTGRVTGLIDLAGLYDASGPRHPDAVANGIAYMPETGHLLVTGKLWPRLYEIELIPAPAQPS